MKNDWTSTFVPKEMHEGLSKREYFAGQAMMGILADGAAAKYVPRQVAGVALNAADALLNELAKEPTDETP